MNIGFSKFLAFLYTGRQRVKSAFRVLWSDRPALVFSILALFFNALSWSVAVLLQRSIGDESAILHYNVVFGIDLIGSAVRFYLTPLLGLGIVIINLLWGAWMSSQRNRLLSMVLVIFAAIVNFFCLLALYFMYLVNFS